jgi:geranylgeranylglycerol-phosphate geranylgeranyltransferase
MRRSWATSVLALVRLPNLLLSAAGVAIGGVLAQGHLAFPAVLQLAMVSAILLGAAGNIANDLADQEIDRINRPARPLVSGVVASNTAIVIGGLCGGLGLLAAWFTDPRVFQIGVVALVVMLLYSPLLKPRGVVGNLAVAAIASLPMIYGATAVGWWRAGLAASGLAAILHFAREIVKDLEDVAGDDALGRRTIPLAFGREPAFLIAAATLVLFVPASFAPYFAGWYGRRYAIAVGILDLGVGILIARLLDRQLAGAKAGLKAAMLCGLAALLWDRL